MCQHPNIIKLIDLFENQDYYFIVLEYLEGKDLYDYLQSRNYCLPEERVKELTMQMIHAIVYLHSYGIVHRDIKLENIMMTECSEQGSCKIADFGLAKIIGPSEKAREPFGTLGYVAPEVLKKEPYDAACDLYSLGCLTYALLCGSLPFDSGVAKETIKLTLSGEVQFELPIWQKVSHTGKKLLQSLLAKNPRERISLEELQEHPWFNSIKDHKQSTTSN